MRDEARYKREYRRTQVGRAALYMSMMRKRCADKGISFNLDREWLISKIAYGRCEQTGIPFDFAAPAGRNRSPWALSFDRINSSLGYTKANTQAVVWAYNAAKGTGIDDDVYFMARCLLGLIPLENRGIIAPLPINGRYKIRAREE